MKRKTVKETMMDATVMVALMALEQIFAMLEERSYLSNNWKKWTLFSCCPSALCLAEGKQKLGKVQNVLEEKHTKPKGCVADTLAINKHKVSLDKSCVCVENALILKPTAEDLDCMMPFDDDHPIDKAGVCIIITTPLAGYIFRHTRSDTFLILHCLL